MNVKDIRLILKSCAEDTRLRILNLLDDEEVTVKVICETLKISQSVVSKHLSRLRLLKMVVDRRSGNLVYYRLTRKTESFQYKITLFLHEQCQQISSLQDDKKILLKVLENA
ncbi:MAG: metalloregulator ArsR/SmtB family transcription factor [Candidatus Omnitrophica bacterium]|nr:metalloregulator ArsR/SmtB family transcription factor [Candidatus Omnitrophota bacterium]